jgi:hypothetical protein
VEVAMTIIRELADAYQMISDVVRNTRMFIDSVNDGREYLASRHPAAVKEFSELITQMHTTVTGLATVTKVVGAFDFTVEGQDLDRQPARFNDMTSWMGYQTTEESYGRLLGTRQFLAVLSVRYARRGNCTNLCEDGGGTLHPIYFRKGLSVSVSRWLLETFGLSHATDSGGSVNVRLR